MYYRRMSPVNNSQWKIGIIVMVMLITITVSSLGALKSLAMTKNQGDTVFTYIINAAMPVVRTVAMDTQEKPQTNFSAREAILSLMGINIYNPISVIGREISFFGTVPYSSSIELPKRNFAFNPFNIDENSIFKDKNENNTSSQGATQNGGNNLNDLPNSVVPVYDPNLKKNNLNIAKPEVFIYHTHTTESYLPGEADKDDPAKNVCAVGEQLSNELQNNYGISVVQDKTNHSVLYEKAYYRSAETIDKYLKKYGDFKLIIDLHRDSGENKKAFTTKMNGENVAKIMFVMTKKNPHFDKNQELVNKLQQISERLYPGFSKGIMYYNYGTRYFNQDKSNNAILIEVGADINSLEEAKNSAKYIGRIIAEYINGK